VGLRESGKLTEDEIDKYYVPKTFEERRRYAEDKKNDLVQMRRDVAYLLHEVHAIKEKLGLNANTTAAAAAAKAAGDTGTSKG